MCYDKLVLKDILINNELLFLNENYDSNSEGNDELVSEDQSVDISKEDMNPAL